MSIRRSINALIRWQQILPLLDVEVTVSPLPMIVKCPLCSSTQLYIYNDTRFGGDWHYCHACKSSGDMIELAAKFWKCNLHQAIAKLVSLGAEFPPGTVTRESINAYKTVHIDRQIRHNKLVKTSVKHMADGTASIGNLLNWTGILQEQRRPDWSVRMGRFMGACNHKVIRQAITPHMNDENGRYAGHKIQLFKGGGWKDILTIPFHDLPGRLSGFLFVGRRAHSTDFDFKIIDSSSPHGKQAEIGACMYDIFRGPTARRDWFKDDVFVMTDPLVALRLQARHVRDAALPLPILGTHNRMLKRGRGGNWELVSYKVWQSQPGRKFIFWGPELSANLFNMAARAEGRVWISSAPNRLGRESSQNWLRRMQQQARHWTDVLESNLRVLPEEAAVSLLREIDIPSDTIREFLTNCSTDVKERVERYRNRITSLCNIAVNGREIVESELGWCIGVEGECISNVIVRIEKVVCRPNAADDEPLCKGTLIFQGRTAPFTERLEVLENGMIRWLKREVLKQFKALPTIKNHWSKQLFEIARQFHAPDVIEEDGRFGWKPMDSVFSLPKFTIDLHGGVVAAEAAIVDPYAPGQDMKPPTGLSPGVSALLENTPVNKVFWATTACICANVAAPAMGQPTVGIGLIGHGGLMVGKETTRALGCCEYTAGGRNMGHREKAAHDVDDIIMTHAWPLYIGRTPMASKRIFDVWINGDYQRNGVLHTDDVHADMLATLDAWRFVSEHTPLQIAGPEALRYGPQLMAEWLRRLCKNTLKLQSDADTYVQRVLDDLKDMLAAHGDTAVIEAASELIDDCTDSAARGRHFVALVYRFISDGIIPFERDSMARHLQTPTITQVDDGQRAPGVFVPRDALALGLARKNIPIPDPGRITDTLRDANALDCECSYNGRVGWFIIENWWNRQVEYCRGSHQYQFKVIGGA